MDGCGARRLSYVDVFRAGGDGGGGSTEASAARDRMRLLLLEFQGVLAVLMAVVRGWRAGGSPGSERRGATEYRQINRKTDGWELDVDPSQVSQHHVFPFPDLLLMWRAIIPGKERGRGVSAGVGRGLNQHFLPSPSLELV